MFYGDGMITPAISVLGAVEGLEIIAPDLHPFIVPVTVVIVLLLFAKVLPAAEPQASTVDAAHQLALDQGLIVTRPPIDYPWGVRECHIRHPDGHTFRVGAGIEEE